MGCDIHFVVEHNYEGRGWVGVYSTNCTPAFERSEEPTEGSSWSRSPLLRDRDYGFFNALCGVRGDGPATPKGLPDDASDLAHAEVDAYGEDGHSHSHCSLLEFIQTKDAIRDPVGNAKAVLGGDETARLRIAIGYAAHEVAKYRVIYWFDN